ncbi:MAG: MFS transporter [Rhizobiales bacterium]|nr:MFS transporter [Hyphomicrobiales bacterium]
MLFSTDVQGPPRPVALAEAHLPLRRILTAITGIYLVQSLIGGFTFQGIPAALRASGASLELIGLFSLVIVPWALKFLWAPAIERYRLPFGGPRRSRQVVAIAQALGAVCFLAIVFAGPQSAWVLLVLLCVLAFAAATADIACDGYAIQQLTQENRGWGNTAQVGGGYLGIVFGGGLFLIILGWYGWMAAGLAMCCLLVLFTIPFLTTPEPQPGDRDAGRHTPSLRFALSRREVRYGLLIAVAFELGVRLVQSMNAPFLIDRGFDLVNLGILKGSGAVVSGIAGTLVGGVAVRLWGAQKCVIAGVVIQAGALLALFAASATTAAPLWLLGAITVAKSVVMAFGFVSLYSLLMGFSSPRQAGVDFTLFQCADAFVAGLAGLASGIIAHRLGYPVCFGLAATFGLAACLAMPRLIRSASDRATLRACP